jgi:hypothetical protein
MNTKGVHSWVRPEDKEDVRGIGLNGESDLDFQAYIYMTAAAFTLPNTSLQAR